jgi:prevent-host-death family protein
VRYLQCVKDETKGLREVRDSLGKRVDLAYYKGLNTIITDNGEPRAVLISYETYEALRTAADGAGGRRASDTP